MKTLFNTLKTLPFIFCLLIANTSFAQYPPAIDFETIMNGFFADESGLINFGDYRLAFAPEPPFNGMQIRTQRLDEEKKNQLAFLSTNKQKLAEKLQALKNTSTKNSLN